MWGLTALTIALFVLVGSAAGSTGLLFDVPAFVIAIVLVARKGPMAGHGWAKLALECLGCVLGFMAVFGAFRGGS